VARRPKLSKTLAVTNGDTFDREATALAVPPYPGWTAERERRAAQKGEAFDLSLGHLLRYLRKTKPAKLDYDLVHKLARDLDPERTAIKSGGGTNILVMVELVDEKPATVVVLTDD
jgi:hypothetical protein